MGTLWVCSMGCVYIFQLLPPPLTPKFYVLAFRCVWSTHGVHFNQIFNDLLNLFA